MWLKLVILALLLAIVVSLFSGLFFLVKDTNGSGRLVTALSVRIGLTVAIMLLIAYGFWSGQFAWNTPWLH
ncbi:twin transmembrane helix small protein [Halopseudomonas pelagia]|uniref:twin transmembrane helix small protein n=1 Tax=Halopseudomonas pelagia TaxID=553151 RepID=UPI0003A0CAE1|nr:twin transmembrane helix small protein [Halopseudomonas pelagia]|tara:strand:- start:3067 stop:3279 length:213 start_codon:yes stop_codon:yes gene_type:complete